jgi:4-hydroxy-3-polyprenylbenzoate decarboxylase
LDPQIRGGDTSAILFDNIKGYPAGYRVLTSQLYGLNRVALTLGLPQGSEKELVEAIRQRLPQWEASFDQFPPKVVQSGPILENVHSRNDLNLFEFPVPKWHELDGGRYIGTADSVITRDPDTGEVNLGTYRIMVHDEKTTALYISPGKHGRLHYQKWHAQGKSCPVAISIGHNPLMFAVSCTPLTAGTEYNWAGVIRGEPMEVIIEEITGLPIPAESEIVIAGWCPPDETRIEGPFGEWTGYYASKERPAPIIEVERIYHRNDPIILGSCPRRPPGDSTLFRSVFDSAILRNELIKGGIPDVVGVWRSELAGTLLTIISIKQRYPGHAKQAALFASQTKAGSYFGRYMIVVDEDIDPTNIQDVIWALCFRSDPEKDIDIIRRCRSTPLDPTIRKPTNAFFNSRAFIDACKPFEWIDEFPRVVEVSPELADKFSKKWKGLFQG